MSRKQQPEPRRLRDLPGWEEACEQALRARLRMPAGHFIGCVGPGALRSAGLFVAPPSVEVATMPLVLCLAIGIQSSGQSRGGLRQKVAALDGKKSNVINLHAARQARGLQLPDPLYCFGADKAMAVALGKSVDQSEVPPWP